MVGSAGGNIPGNQKSETIKKKIIFKRIKVRFSLNEWNTSRLFYDESKKIILETAIMVNIENCHPPICACQATINFLMLWLFCTCAAQ